MRGFVIVAMWLALVLVPELAGAQDAEALLSYHLAVGLSH